MCEDADNGPVPALGGRVLTNSKFMSTNDVMSLLLDNTQIPQDKVLRGTKDSFYFISAL